MKDDEIIPLLHGLDRPTFFTLDDDFFKPRLRHKQYCLIYLDVAQYESAAFVRRAVKHQSLSAKAKRMGKVLRASHIGLLVWELHAEERLHLKW